MIDPVEALLKLFYDDTDLRAVLQGETRVRLYGSPPGLGKEAINADNSLPYKSLAVQQSGGTVASNVPVIYPMFYLMAYGQEGYEAADVLTKVYNVLYYTDGERKGSVKCNRMIANRWFLYYAEMQLGNPLTEQQSNWPVAYATVRAKFDSLKGA